MIHMKLSKKYGGLQFFASETWKLNETLDIYRVNGSKRGYYTADFISNGEKFAQIQTEDDNDDQGQYLEYYKVANSGSPTLVYHSVQHNTDGYEWENQAYRTLTFSTPPTGDLLTWLKSNGVKQPAPPTVVETSLHFGADALAKAYLGADSLDRIYLGTDLLYQTLNEYTVTETLNNVTTIGTHPVKILEASR